jgi:predicted porin
MGKNMKKWVASAMALTAMACAQQALARSQVSIYGIIDTGVVYTSHANAAGNSVLKMPT